MVKCKFVGKVEKDNLFFRDLNVGQFFINADNHLYVKATDEYAIECFSEDPTEFYDGEVVFNADVKIEFDYTKED